MLHFLPVLLQQSETHRSVGSRRATATVELLKSPDQKPQSPLQRAIVRALKDSGVVSVSALVARIASELYRDELHQGAGALEHWLVR